jgi:hypothetical protein
MIGIAGLTPSCSLKDVALDLLESRISGEVASIECGRVGDALEELAEFDRRDNGWPVQDVERRFEAGGDRVDRAPHR